MRHENYLELKKLATEKGADLFGVAALERVRKYLDPELKAEAESLPYLVSIGIRLQRSVLNTLVDRPNQIYKTHYRQVNAALDSITHHLASFIQRQGFRAIPIAASFVIDWERQSSHFSHRHGAIEAGLGFLGRNNLLVHPEYGAGVRLASILTDMPLTTDSPVDGDCGDCNACLIACPAGAISRYDFDFEKCYGQIKKFAREKNYNLHICGLCVRACADARDKARS